MKKYNVTLFHMCNMEDFCTTTYVILLYYYICNTTYEEV
jgi:hypothetical protein